MQQGRFTGGLVAAFVVGLAAVAGCSQPPVPEDHFYRLSVAAPAVRLPKPKLAGTLEMDQFVAEGLIGGRALVYAERDTPTQLKEFYYHRWVEPPNAMMRDQVAGYLRAAGVADNVITPKLRVDVDYEAVGKINRFEMINSKPRSSSVEIEIGIRRVKDRKLLLFNTYRKDVEARGDSVAAAVDAFNAALTDISAQLVADIERM